MKFHPPNKAFTKAYQKFLHLPMGRLVLVLTTTGRKTGKPHSIGLQYELIDDRYYVGAADGEHADWYRNILHSPKVSIQVGKKSIEATASTVDDPDQICDYLEMRLKRHPLMIRTILRIDGTAGKIDRAALLEYSRKIRLVILTPC
jgi:deazaflavin-dependent oxidoreductase (nitroreductase family)